MSEGERFGKEWWLITCPWRRRAGATWPLSRHSDASVELVEISRSPFVALRGSPSTEVASFARRVGLQASLAVGHSAQPIDHRETRDSHTEVFVPASARH